MASPSAPGRSLTGIAVTVLATFALVIGLSATAAAAPGDDEGGTPSLRQALDEATRGFIDAQAALENSKKRQAELVQRLTQVEARLVQLGPEAAEIAKAAYRTGGALSAASALLTSSSPTGFMNGAARLNALAIHNDRQLRDYGRLRVELGDSQRLIDAEVVAQEKHLATMARKKQDAERALAGNGGGQASGGPGGSSGANAQPAPRRADGSWPSESCSVDDPTTSGCLTPRTRHALAQAKAAGFTRYVSCYRPSGSGEHPKGRACDFAAQVGGFGGVASGGDRTYGNNLAAYFIRNASRLGVLYVIWFRQIWLPSSGWRAYNSGNGDPASDHTNHVHLSEY